MIGLKDKYISFLVILAVLIFFIATIARAETTLPELYSSAAKKLLAGTAERGQRVRVLENLQFETGEKFLKVELDGQEREGAFWIQSATRQPEGTLVTLESPTYLFKEPVAESEDPSDPAPQEIEEQNLKSRHPLNPGKIGMSPACTTFIRQDGMFGPWGMHVMNMLSESKHPNLFRENLDDMKGICPRFHQMSFDEKKNFWAWVITSMADGESSCREKLKARGVNGTVAGLLQMHLGKEHVYGCRKGINSLNAKDNIECGLTILNNDIRRTNKLFPRNRNYWEVLRPHTGGGKKVLRFVKKYSPCY